MYNFRVLTAEYVLSTTILQEDKVDSSLEITYSLEAKFQNVDDVFVFTIDRKEIKLYTGKKETDILVDSMMQKLGNSLYPISLLVSKEAKIVGIKHFNEVRERWNGVAANILEEAYSVPTDKYIAMAKTNMDDESRFVSAFSRQTFIQLLFRSREDAFFWFSTENLGDIRSDDIVRCDKTDERNNIIYFETVGEWSNECRFEYTFSELGDALTVNGFVQKQMAEDKAPVIKKMSLYMRDDNREVKKANKVISFLID